MRNMERRNQKKQKTSEDLRGRGTSAASNQGRTFVRISGNVQLISVILQSVNKLGRHVILTTRLKLPEFYCFPNEVREIAECHIDTGVDEDGASKGDRKNFKIREIPTEFSDVDFRNSLGTIKHDNNAVALNQLKLAKYTTKCEFRVTQLVSSLC